MKKALPILLLIAVATILLWLRFPSFFEYGNSRFIEPWGDGYKAYHAIFYHVDYDSTNVHFEGMNYPYGEHAVPGACQPFFSNGMRTLRQVGLDLSQYDLGLFHAFLLLALVLSAVFLYLIFVRLQLPMWYSMLLALALTALAPQIARMCSHYGLAHPELLPLVFYLLLRWHEKPRWSWSLAIGGAVLVYSGIHFYYFAILSFAIVGWVGFRWLLQRDWKATPSYVGHGLLMLGLPFLFYYFWMLLPDMVTDRNPVPWGFFNYSSTWSGVFSDLSQPHWQGVDKIRPIYHNNIEGQSYIGLVAIAFLLYFFGKLLVSIFRRWPLPVNDFRESYLKYLLWSGMVILLFAHGIPFIWPYGEKLLSYAGPIQQFRSIGRFAWVFFYAANISAFYYLYRWSETQQVPWRKAVILVVPLLVLTFEAYHYNTAFKIDLDEIDHWAEGERYTDLPIDYDRFQACLPIPYFNIGSDNFWMQEAGWMGQRVHTLSMQTGLPLSSAMLTRTSLQQTINQLQLVSEPYRRPVILDDYPNDKPLLLFWEEKKVQEYEGYFDHMNEAANLLYENDRFQLYELPLTSFEQRIANKVRRVKAQLDSMHTTPNAYLLSDSLGEFYYQSYDDKQVDQAYFGTGEFSGQMSYWNRLVDTLWQSSYTGDLTISFWMFINSDRAPRASIAWKEYDAETGQLLFEQERQVHRTISVYDDQGWAMVEFSLPRQRANSRIELIVRNDDKKEGPLRIDELLIRPQDLDVGRQMEEGIWWNNRYYLR